MVLIRYVLRNKPESLADMREPVLEAFTKFLDLLGMVQVGEHALYSIMSDMLPLGNKAYCQGLEPKGLFITRHLCVCIHSIHHLL